jgi:nitrate reductase NapE component
MKTKTKYRIINFAIVTAVILFEIVRVTVIGY